MLSLQYVASIEIEGTNKTMQKGMSLTQHPVKRLHAL